MAVKCSETKVASTHHSCKGRDWLGTVATAGVAAVAQAVWWAAPASAGLLRAGFSASKCQVQHFLLLSPAAPGPQRAESPVSFRWDQQPLP